MGKKGAELLKEVMNRMFSAMIAQIETREGFIASFAGDAFTAVFPGSSGSNAVEACNAVMKAMKTAGKISIAGKQYKLSVKIGAASGMIHWDIFGKENNAYVFKGKPMLNAALAEQKAEKGQIVLHSSMTGLFTDNCISMTDKDFCILKPCNVTVNKELAGQEIPLDIQRKFVDTAVIEKAEAGEFREVVSLFISYRNMKTEDERVFLDFIMQNVNQYGAFLSLIDYGDKGNLIFIIFGAPISYEDNIRRAIDFALHLKKMYADNIKAGMSFGKVYAGLIGSGSRANYTVIGDRVNTAARFMQNAEWGSIWISEEIGRNIQMTHNISYMGAMSFKGKTEPVELYELQGTYGVQDIFSYEGNFVGRQKESGFVSDALRKTIDKGKSGILYVYGEPGIGKTRLVFEVLKERGDNIEKFVMKCDDILRKSLNPIEYMLKYFFKLADNAKENSEMFRRGMQSVINNIPQDNTAGHFASSELSRLESVIAGMLGIEYENSLYERLDSKARFDNYILAVLELIKGLSMNRPTVIVIEDMQWIDQDTYKILPKFINALSQFPVLFIVTSRMNDDGTKPQINAEDIESSYIDLDSMHEKDIDSFISQQLPYPPDERLRKMILEKAEGNPFYMEQLCLYLLENDFLDLHNGAYILKDQKEEMPKGIFSVIISRIDRLSNELREIVQNASVLGRTFDIRILSMMLSGKMLSMELVQGERERIWNALSEVQYIFKHALLRDAVYQMQLHKRLSNLHLLAAESIEKAYPAKEETYSDLARHYENAGKLEKCLDYFEKAADYAEKNFRNEEAIELYNKYLSHQANEEERLHIMMKVGEIHERIGDWIPAERIYSELMILSDKYDNEIMRADSLNRHAFILNRLSKSAKALEEYRQSLSIYEKHNSLLGISGAYNNIGMVYETMEDDSTAIEYYLKALKYLEDKPKTEELLKVAMYAYNNLGYAKQKHRELDEAGKYFDKSIEISDKLNIKRNAALLNSANIYYLKNDYEKAVELYLKMLGNSKEVGDRYLIRVITNNLGSVETMLGRYENALDFYQQALEMAQSINDEKGMRMIYGNMGDVNAELGNLDKAEQYFKLSIEMAYTLNDLRGICISKGNQGMLLNIRGDYSNAETVLLDALERTSKLNIPYYRYSYLESIIEARLKLNRVDECDDMLEQMKQIAARDDMKYLEWQKDLAEAKIACAIRNPQAVSMLEMLIEKYRGKEAGAKAHFELAMFSKNESIAKEAIEHLKNCHEHSPKYIYLHYIEILESRFNLN